MKYSIGLIQSAPKKPPIFLRFRSSEALIISTVALAIFTDIFLYGVPSLAYNLTNRKSFPYCHSRLNREWVWNIIQYNLVFQYYWPCMQLV